MKFIVIALLFATPYAWSANQCRQPLERLVNEAESVGRRAGPQCYTAILNGNTTTGERAKKLCKEKLGKVMYNNQAAILRRLYDNAVHLCNADCEEKNYDYCRKGLSELPPYGTKGARRWLNKIRD